MIIYSLIYYYNKDTVIGFFENNKEHLFIDSVKIILINNTDQDISDMFNKYNIDIITKGLNLGYFGAARFALDYLKSNKIKFSFFIHLNSDLKFLKYKEDIFYSYPFDVPVCIVPKLISNVTGMNQNPLYIKKPSYLKIKFLSLITSSFILFNLYNLARNTFHYKKSMKNKEKSVSDIYAPHGAFVCLNSKAIECGVNFYHPSFLFCEELSLAEQLNLKSVSIIYNDSLVLLHEEHDTTGSNWRSKKLCKYHKDSLDQVLKFYY